MNIKYYLKIFLGIVGTIFLGAIGSGLWERIISPLIDKIMNLSINGINFFFVTYKDSIYSEASNGFREFYSQQLWMIFLMLMPLLYIRLLRGHPANKKTNANPSHFKSFVRSKNGYWSIYGLTLAVIVLITFSTLRHTYISNTITYATTSMEIIKPYITEKEYMLIRSHYFSISNTEQFEIFYKKVNELAEKNNLQLHDFKPL